METINFEKLKKPYFIAEIGGNHAGEKKFALEGIKNAKKSGADCVKFQMYRAEDLIIKTMPVMQHVKSIGKEKFQFERFKKLEINENDIKDYYKACRKAKIHLSVTPFYEDCIKFLSNYVSFFKIASGDINYFPLIEKISNFKKPVVVSTGMSSEKEIKETLKILKNNQVILLHCVSCYPTYEKDLNLKSFEMLKKFNKILGFSDHTKGVSGAVMSLSYGAMVFEKHFLPNMKVKKVGDFKLSLNPNELKEYIETINHSFLSIGQRRNGYFKNEKIFFKTLRRSPYLNLSKKKNNKLYLKDISFLRPFDKKGIDINEIKNYFKKTLKKPINKNQLLKKDQFKT